MMLKVSDVMRELNISRTSAYQLMHRSAAYVLASGASGFRPRQISDRMMRAIDRARVPK